VKYVPTRVIILLIQFILAVMIATKFLESSGFLTHVISQQIMYAYDDFKLNTIFHFYD
jgi:hypothetical protein